MEPSRELSFSRSRNKKEVFDEPDFLACR